MSEEFDKNNFICYGRFYDLSYKDKTEKCRSELNIFKKSFYDNFCETAQFGSIIENEKLDAIVVMMNPGNSKPIGDYKYNVFTPKQVEVGEHLKISYVKTKPDTTQDQIMKIMLMKNWDFVKVINLSDFREIDSSKIYRKINELTYTDIYTIHSIFSCKRTVEVNSILSRTEKIIAAWGVDEHLEKLIELALNNPKLVNRIGLEKNDNSKIKFYYYHPLQRGKPMTQKEWLDNILKLL